MNKRARNNKHFIHLMSFSEAVSNMISTTNLPVKGQYQLISLSCTEREYICSRLSLIFEAILNKNDSYNALHDNWHNSHYTHVTIKC